MHRQLTKRLTALLSISLGVFMLYMGVVTITVAQLITQVNNPLESIPAAFTFLLSIPYFAAGIGLVLHQKWSYNLSLALIALDILSALFRGMPGRNDFILIAIWLLIGLLIGICRRAQLAEY